MHRTDNQLRRAEDGTCLSTGAVSQGAARHPHLSGLRYAGQFVDRVASRQGRWPSRWVDERLRPLSSRGSLTVQAPLGAGAAPSRRAPTRHLSPTPSGTRGAFLDVQNDGNLVIYDVPGTPIWVTGTVGL
jgi:hypothetical protein